MRNDYIAVGFIGLLLGLFIGGLIGIKNVNEAAMINAVLVHQVDSQTRMIANVVGFEAADEIRRMSHDVAVARAK